MSHEYGMSERFFLVPIARFQADRIASELQTGIGMAVSTVAAVDIPHVSSKFSTTALFFLYTGVPTRQWTPGTASAPTYRVEREQLNTVLTAIGTHGGRFVFIGPSSVLNTIPPQYAGFWYGRMSPERLRSELPDALHCIRCDHVWCSSSDLKSVFAPRRTQPVKQDSATSAYFASLSFPGTRNTAHSLSAVLTPRQREVAALVGRGTSNSEIAHTLNISLATVKSHVSAAMTALNAANRTELAISIYGMTDNA